MKVIKLLIVIVSFLFITGCGKSYLQEGKDYFLAARSGNAFESFTKATESFTKAIQSNPKEQEAYFFRGASYSALGQFNQAIEDYTKTIELNPKFSEAYWNRGYCYANIGMYDNAIADYTKSLELGTKMEALVYQNRSRVYFRKAMYNEAEADIRKYLQLNPGDQGAMAALEELKKAKTDPGFDSNALKFRHIAEQPQYGGVTPTEAMKKTNEKFIQSVIQSYGTQERAYEEALKLAWKIYGQGDYATAMRRFNQAWLLDENDPEVFYGYSLILRKWGYTKEADTWEQKAKDGGYEPVSNSQPK